MLGRRKKVKPRNTQITEDVIAVQRQYHNPPNVVIFIPLIPHGAMSLSIV